MASVSGAAEAQRALGHMHYCGDGVPQDYQRAAGLFKLAAEQGNADAQYNLGLSHYHGKGVPQDYKRASRLFKLAAHVS